jgi:hypothetical protein
VTCLRFFRHLKSISCELAALIGSLKFRPSAPNAFLLHNVTNAVSNDMVERRITNLMEEHCFGASRRLTSDIIFNGYKCYPAGSQRRGVNRTSSRHQREFHTSGSMAPGPLTRGKIFALSVRLTGTRMGDLSQGLNLMCMVWSCDNILTH